jgi:glycosyltransferase involved in cell wall biosynthesis
MDYKVTIVICCYNKSSTIKRCIDSVKNQSYPFEQIIIVDDCSTDNSAQIINNSLIKNSKIFFIRNPINLGLTKSRNIALGFVKTKYVSFLDADDYWHKDKLKKQFFLIKKYKYDFIYNGYQWTQNGMVTKRYVLKPFLKGKNTLPHLLIGNYISGSASAVTCLTRNIIKVGFFDVKLEKIANAFGEDWDMWLRLSKISNFSFVNRTLTFIDDNGAYSSAPISIKIKIKRFLAHFYIRGKHINEPSFFSLVYKIQREEYFDVKNGTSILDLIFLHFKMIKINPHFYFLFFLKFFINKLTFSN